MKTYKLDLFYDCNTYMGKVEITANNMREATIEAQKIVNACPSLFDDNKNSIILIN